MQALMMMITMMVTVMIIEYRLGGMVISDGGCACPGDFAKAFGAGADFVMAGGMFAAHTESGGDLVEIQGKLYKQFYGASAYSDAPMISHLRWAAASLLST